MKKYIISLLILFNFTIVGCYEKISKNELYEKEAEFISLLKFYNVPTDNSIVVLMPSSKCASCKLGAIKPLSNIDKLYILASDSILQFPKKNSQKCIIYKSEFIEKKRLDKLYPELFTIKNHKIVNYEALTN